MDFATARYDHACFKYDMASLNCDRAARNENVCQQEYDTISEQYRILKSEMREIQSRLKASRAESSAARDSANVAALGLVQAYDVLKGKETTLSLLPDEILLKIFSYLESNDLALSIATVSPRLNVVARDKRLWKNVNINRKVCAEVDVIYMLQEFCKENLRSLNIFSEDYGINIVTQDTIDVLRYHCPNLEWFKIRNIQLSTHSQISIAFQNLSHIEFQNVLILNGNFPNLLNSNKLSSIRLRNTRIEHFQLIRNLPASLTKIDLDDDALIWIETQLLLEFIPPETTLNDLRMHMPNCQIVHN